MPSLAFDPSVSLSPQLGKFTNLKTVLILGGDR